MKNEAVDGARGATRPTPGPDLREAMKITDPAEAQSWLKKYVAWLIENGTAEAEAIKVAVHNVCCHAAIYAHTQLAEVQKTFGGKHPVYQVGEEEINAKAQRAKAQELETSRGDAEGAEKTQSN